MKLEKILDVLSSFEKNAFLKIIDSIIADDPKNAKKIYKILSDSFQFTHSPVKRGTHRLMIP